MSKITDFYIELCEGNEVIKRVSAYDLIVNAGLFAGLKDDPDNQTLKDVFLTIPNHRALKIIGYISINGKRSIRMRGRKFNRKIFNK